MDALREWTARLLSPQTLWVALWVGLGVFTVVLVLLINTRIGKSQPLRKCAILAVWFHLLLLIYATSIPIVASRPGGDGQVTISLGMGDVSTTQAAPSAHTAQFDHRLQLQGTEADLGRHDVEDAEALVALAAGPGHKYHGLVGLVRAVLERPRQFQHRRYAAGVVVGAWI